MSHRLVLSLSLSCALFACSSQPDDNPGADASADTGDARQVAGINCQFNPSIPWDLIGETVQLKSADDSTCLYIQRRNDCPPDWICKAVPFTILEARVGADGKTKTQTAASALHWEATHHNWNDHATIAIDGTTYRLDFVFNGDTIDFELSASGASTWGPMVVEPVSL